VKYCSKINLSNVYEQVHIEPEDVSKTTFAMVFGTYKSMVMQQGNCNMPVTFLQLITAIFRDAIGVFIHTYLDNLFVFSDMLDNHEKHLEYVFQKLCEHCLFLEKAKCNLYSESMDCLRHLVNDHGLHTDADKMARIRDWCTPRSLKDVQCFLGLVQYLVHFMPDVTAYTGPISAICRNGQPFYWKLLYEVCFNHIKAIACKLHMLKPIDPTMADLIWVICDASMSSTSMMYGQGMTWQTCCPTGFMSKKFTAVQMNYHMFEMETIAILKALLKWEDKLLSHRVLVVTDHKALKFFKTQQCLNSQQVCWMEFLACFDFDITYVKGEMNLVADALSRYYENDHWDESHNVSHYINADAQLDPEGEDLPWVQFEESWAMCNADTALCIGICPQQ
jgi:RNase H-like domain found in reverse transcriptase/Reverse transcriptase (RNA-dependent DNA polymerase)